MFCSFAEALGRVFCTSHAPWGRSLGWNVDGSLDTYTSFCLLKEEGLNKVFAESSLCDEDGLKTKFSL